MLDPRMDLQAYCCLTTCIISLLLGNYFTEIGILITKLIEKFQLNSTSVFSYYSSIAELHLVEMSA